MSRWYVIFLSVLTVLLVLGIALAGIYLHHRYPSLLPWSIVAAVGVALGSIKALLEVSKLVGDLDKAQLEAMKLTLEIEELQRKREGDASKIVRPTEVELRRLIKLKTIAKFEQRSSREELFDPEKDDGGIVDAEYVDIDELGLSHFAKIPRTLRNTFHSWWSWIVRAFVRERSTKPSDPA